MANSFYNFDGNIEDVFVELPDKLRLLCDHKSTPRWESCDGKSLKAQKKRHREGE